MKSTEMRNVSSYHGNTTSRNHENKKEIEQQIKIESILTCKSLNALFEFLISAHWDACSIEVEDMSMTRARPPIWQRSSNMQRSKFILFIVRISSCDNNPGDQLPVNQGFLAINYVLTQQREQ